MNSLELSDFFSRVVPFTRLSDTERADLLTASEIRKVSAKQILFTEGEEAESGWIVLVGRFAMIKSSPNGRELIAELLPAGDLFGIVSFIDSRPYPLTARAQCDGLVLRIPRRAMLPLLQLYPNLVREFVGVVTGRFQASQNLARALAHDKVDARICSVLLAMIPRFTLNSQERPDQLFLGRQELADLVGTTIETASRVIKGLERDGIVDAGSVGSVLLKDLAKLAVIAEKGAD